MSNDSQTSLINDIWKLSSWLLLNCQNKCTNMKYFFYMFPKVILSSELIHQSFTISTWLISSDHTQMSLPPCRVSHCFTLLKTLKACSQSNKWTFSKPNRQRLPAESLSLVLAADFRTNKHTFMCSKRSDYYMLSHMPIQTRRQTYIERYPAQGPLTWTCCSHSATHKSLGSRQHCRGSLPCWTWLHGNKSL